MRISMDTLQYLVDQWMIWVFIAALVVWAWLC